MRTAFGAITVVFRAILTYAIYSRDSLEKREEMLGGDETEGKRKRGTGARHWLGFLYARWRGKMRLLALFFLRHQRSRPSHVTTLLKTVVYMDPSVVLPSLSHPRPALLKAVQACELPSSTHESTLQQFILTGRSISTYVIGRI